MGVWQRFLADDFVIRFVVVSARIAAFQVGDRVAQVRIEQR